MNTISQSTKPAFQLKGSIVTLSVLQILDPQVEAITQQLKETVQKNPNFFKSMPVLIDLQKLYNYTLDIDFKKICQQLRKHGLIPVGVSHANPTQAKLATEAGLGLLSHIKTGKGEKNTQTTKTNAQVITQPIRSGQQIYSKNCDLVVLASVSHGAEIISDGDIHVYGALRGRAIAGANGDVGARIFCQKLEAELVCIAGHYKLQDDFKNDENEFGQHGTQVYFYDDHIIIAAIGSPSST